MRDPELLLKKVRELVRGDIYPVRQRLGVLGVGNLLNGYRCLSEKERAEGRILMERLLGANSLLIEMLGIDR